MVVTLIYTHTVDFCAVAKQYAQLCRTPRNWPSVHWRAAWGSRRNAWPWATHEPGGAIQNTQAALVIMIMITQVNRLQADQDRAMAKGRACACALASRGIEANAWPWATHESGGAIQNTQAALVIMIMTTQVNRAAGCRRTML